MRALFWDVGSALLDPMRGNPIGSDPHGPPALGPPPPILPMGPARSRRTTPAGPPAPRSPGGSGPLPRPRPLGPTPRAVVFNPSGRENIWMPGQKPPKRAHEIYTQYFFRRHFSKTFFTAAIISSPSISVISNYLLKISSPPYPPSSLVLLPKLAGFNCTLHCKKLAQLKLRNMLFGGVFGLSGRCQEIKQTN